MLVGWGWDGPERGLVMRRSGSAGGRWRRWALVVSASVAAGLAVVFAPVLPVLFGLAGSYYQVWVPWPVRLWLPLGLAVLAGVVLQARPGRLAGVAVARRRWDRLDRAADQTLGRFLAPAVGLAAALMFLTWAPHYLTWPWWPDVDIFALAAQWWDVGVRPYRDTYQFDFPGPIYLAWLLGKAAGWGRTVPYQAFDAACLVALGVAMALWSRALFGGALAGLIGYLGFVVYYLSLDYARAGQRDWFTALFVVLGLMAAQARPGRSGRVASALAFALALAYRPYAVLFLPALLSAAEEGARRPGEPWRRAVLPMAEWVAAAAVFVALAFAPLAACGILDDFLRSLRHLRPGGLYYRNSAGSFVARLAASCLDLRYLTALAVCAGVALAGPARLRRSARTWTAALLGVALYLPLGPVYHGYLHHPILLTTAAAAAFGLGAVLGLTRLTPAARLLIAAVALAAAVPAVPRFCSVGRSAEAVAALARGVPPARSPLGSDGALPCKERVSETFYNWEDYCRLLDHLRKTTTPRTLVANVLRRSPFPPLNGPLGRLSPFPSPQGVTWMYWQGDGLEPEYVRGLAKARDAVRRLGPRRARPPGGVGPRPAHRGDPPRLPVRGPVRPDGGLAAAPRQGVRAWLRRLTGPAPSGRRPGPGRPGRRPRDSVGLDAQRPRPERDGQLVPPLADGGG
jgi:hypothetical protein